MNSRAALPVVITALLAGAIGFFAGKNTRPALDPGSSPPRQRTGAAPRLQNQSSKPEGAVEGGFITPSLQRLLGESMPSDATIGAVTYRVLEERDPTRRAVAIALLLESMTPSNADAIKQAFIDSTSRTGRQHHTEWHLMVRQFGKTMGRTAVTEILKSSGDQSLALEGWAMTDPAAARQYVESLDRADSQYVRKRSALLNGIMLNDPAQAFGLALADPASPVVSQWLIESAIQAAGMEGATAAFQKAMDAAGPGVEESLPFHQIFKSLTDSMFHQNFISGQSEKMLTWLEAQKDQPFITPDLIDHGAKDVILQGKVTEALDWLDRMNVGRETAPWGVESMMQTLVQTPDLLAGLDAGSIDRVVSMAVSQNSSTASLVRMLEKISPAHAERLRALPIPGVTFKGTRMQVPAPGSPR